MHYHFLLLTLYKKCSNKEVSIYCYFVIKKQKQFLMSCLFIASILVLIGQFALLFLSPNIIFFLIILSILIVEVLFLVVLVRFLYTLRYKDTTIRNLVRQYNRARYKIRKQERHKSEFLSITSHQLRTPLTILSGYIELLHEGVYGNVPLEIKEILENMQKTNQRLHKTVENFLSMQNLQKGALSYRFKKESVTDLIQKIVRNLSIKAKRNNVTVIYDTNIAIYGIIDRQKIYHALTNIIDNAISYSKNKKVTITLRALNHRLEFICKDTGIGFSQKEKKDIFKKFTRTKVAKTERVDGTGLGLYICREFITGHNGIVRITSPGAGKGTTVYISIPITQ